ncbi:hypothetical protein PVAP13_2KG242000 [Panicum virgatum]|uniref:Uncharacterized protein n=1 Tax=Panicum virgatum TaxID=38727 RepID=A0A8T0WEH8_PANVG|nr:hypothetical protein PVAP13_2KG242000 [Panicum virgatum]
MTAGDGMRMWGAIGRASLLGFYHQETGLKNQGRDDGWAPGGWFCFLKERQAFLPTDFTSLKHSESTLILRNTVNILGNSDKMKYVC